MAGQRIATALLYLNDEGLEGDETNFPRLGIRDRAPPGAGDPRLVAAPNGG